MRLTFVVLDEAAHTDAVARLKAAIASGTLAPNARRQAQNLALRLQTGVRIAILGPENVGKSHLCNALFGHTSTADDKTSCRLFYSGEDVPDIPDSVLRVAKVQVVPVTSSLLCPGQALDVHTADASADVQAAVLDHFDIVIWCTHSFTEQEAVVWSGASDSLKDHSFLVLTKADELAETGQLQSRIVELQNVVAEEFHSLLPTTTLKLNAVKKAGKAIGDQLLAASGIKALSEALSALVDAGRRADIDSALLFLERNGIGLQFSEAIDGPVSNSGPGSDLCALALSNFTERAFDLAELTFDEAAGDMTEVLQFCEGIAEGLFEDVLNSQVAAKLTPDWTCSFEDATDKIVLLGMENDTRSAADAATILLQLRRDLEYMAFH